MNNEVLMPRELTAENGAKALLIGEFHFPVDVMCQPCEGSGCNECSHTGEVAQEIFVPWTIIKAIYAKAVEGLGSKPLTTNPVVSQNTEIENVNGAQAVLDELARRHNQRVNHEQ